MERNSFTPTFLSRQLAEIMSFVSSESKNVSSGFMEYIRSVKADCIYGKPNLPRDQEKGLERLAILLHALNFSQRLPEVIDGIMKIDDRFKDLYPPKNGISYAQLVEAHEAINNVAVPTSALESMV